SIAAVRPRGDVAARACRATRAAVAAGTAIGKAGANSAYQIDIPGSVAIVRSLPVRPGELALKDLASAAHGAERIAIDDEQRRVRRHDVAAAWADLICQRLVDSRLRRIRRQIVID